MDERVSEIEGGGRSRHDDSVAFAKTAGKRIGILHGGMVDLSCIHLLTVVDNFLLDDGQTAALTARKEPRYMCAHCS
jgi:hypothetical protein